MHSGGKETGRTEAGKEKNGELNTYAGQDEHKHVVWSGAVNLKGRNMVASIMAQWWILYCL